CPPVARRGALAMYLACAAFPVPCTSWLAAPFAGLAFVIVACAQEAAWMAWAVGRAWDPGRVAAAFPGVALTAIGSAVVGWTVGTLVASAATGRPAREALGSRARARAMVVAMLALVTVGLAAAYRPSRVEPPTGVTALGL